MEHQQQEGIWPWSGIFHHTHFYWSGIDFCLRQETSEEDTEADESFVSTDAEGIPNHEASEEAFPETRGCEADVNKDQEDVDQQGVTDEDVEEVSEKVRGEAEKETIETGSDEGETETELTIAPVESTTDQSEEENEAMQVEHKRITTA